MNWQFETHSNVHLANPFFAYANYTPIELVSPVLQPVPDANDLITWSNVQTLIQKIAPLEWTFFFISLTIPRIFTKNSRLDMIRKARNSTNALQVLEDATKEAIKALIGFCFLLLLVPIAGPIALIFYAISELVRYAFKRRYGENASKAAGQDAIWGNETVESRPFISVGITMKGDALCGENEEDFPGKNNGREG